MFGSIDKSKGLLFVTHDLDFLLRGQTQKLREEVESLDANRLLNTAPEDMKRYLQEKYSVTPITLLREQWYAEADEVQVDVRHDRRRWIEDTSSPVLVAGERTDVHIPFTGDRELFYARASTFSSNPPRATVSQNELVFRYEMPSDNTSEVRPLVDIAISEVEQHLAWQRSTIDSHNASLPDLANEAIQQRRGRLLDQSQRAAALGIPIRRREDAPKTYAVSPVRRKAVPTLPPTTTAQYEPEPVWAMEQYEQALKIMQDMALVMERSPVAFKSMDEEALRQHFLVQLNGQFEGKATGETFNMGGKTDILLREGDRNVFIAECKFWKGPKGFRDAIDQLLSYATWRDSKTAILIFNRGTETSTVLSGIEATVTTHEQFKRRIAWSHESGYRYVLHSQDDKNREVILTVLVFHVPN